MVEKLETLFDRLEEKIDGMDADEVLNQERKGKLEYEERKRRFTDLLEKFQREVCTPLNCSYGIKVDDWRNATIHPDVITVDTLEYAGETLTLGGSYPKEKIRTERLSAEGFVRKYVTYGYISMEEMTKKLLGYMPTPQSRD